MKKAIIKSADGSLQVIDLCEDADIITVTIESKALSEIWCEPFLVDIKKQICHFSLQAHKFVFEPMPTKQICSILEALEQIGIDVLIK